MFLFGFKLEIVNEEHKPIQSQFDNFMSEFSSLGSIVYQAFTSFSTFQSLIGRNVTKSSSLREVSTVCKFLAPIALTSNCLRRKSADTGL